MFASSLSIGDSIGLKKLGLVSAGYIQGLSVFAFGAELAGQVYNTRITLPSLSNAMRQMREKALERLRLEALRAGANGVLGLRLAIRDLEPGLVQFSVSGSAVKRPGSKGDQIFLTTFGGAELMELAAAGFTPLGVAIGTSVYQAISLGTTTTANWNRVGGQGILPSVRTMSRDDLGLALTDARDIAFQAMHADAVSQKADGVVGLAFTEQRCSFAPRIVEAVLIGNTVRRSYSVLPDVGFGMPLNDVC